MKRERERERIDRERQRETEERRDRDGKKEGGTQREEARRKRQRDREQDREREIALLPIILDTGSIVACRSLLAQTVLVSFTIAFDANGRSRTEYYCYRAL